MLRFTSFLMILFVGFTLTFTSCTSSEGEESAVTVDMLADASDPVCGMELSDDGIAATAEHDEKTYGFCNTHCKEMFEKEPNKYLSAGSETDGHDHESHNH